VTEIAATKRLRLRLLQADDQGAFVRYRSHPDVARYQSWDSTYAMTDAEALLAGQAGVAFGTPGAWVRVAALDRASGELVGDCAVRVLADQPATAEVGVTLAPERQGSGLATEALGVIVSILFEVHQMHRVSAGSTTAIPLCRTSSDGSASAARRGTLRRTGSRASGPPCASTPFWDASGGLLAGKISVDEAVLAAGLCC
jgi:RimJ/RimL family protein N-acetyltransferase